MGLFQVAGSGSAGGGSGGHWPSTSRDPTRLDGPDQERCPAMRGARISRRACHAQAYRDGGSSCHAGRDALLERGAEADARGRAIARAQSRSVVKRLQILENGATFTLSKAFKDPGIQAGEKVRVSWDMSGKNKIAEAVKIMK